MGYQWMTMARVRGQAEGDKTDGITIRVWEWQTTWQDKSTKGTMSKERETRGYRVNNTQPTHPFNHSIFLHACHYQRFPAGNGAPI